MQPIATTGHIKSYNTPLFIGYFGRRNGPNTARGSENKKIGGTAFDYSHAVVPLPFAAKSLNGISEQLIQSHWQNNYSGAVAALNTVRSRLKQALNDANTPAYLYNGLKREQLFRTDSIVLHELYFANLAVVTLS